MSEMGKAASPAAAFHFFNYFHVVLLLMVIVFLSSGLIINGIQCFFYLTVRPFSRHWYRKINYYVTYSLNSQIIFLVEWWSGSQTVAYWDPKNYEKHYGKEHAYILFNHTYEVDWMMGWLILDKVGVLGNAKVYAKKILRYTPVMGISWFFGESVFLERDWDKDKQTLGFQLNRLVEHPDPIWLVMFAEGTRFTPTKHEASMAIAREKGLPELKHHLLPRTKGFVASLPYIRGKIPAIYDCILAVPKSNEKRATVQSLLLCRPVTATLLFRRIPVDDVPKDEKAAADWLQALYRRKDEVLDYFHTNGSFPQTGEFEDYEEMVLPRRYFPLINTLCWSVIILTPLLCGLVTLLFSGSSTNIAIAIGIICLACLGLYVLVSLTKVNKGSSYGSQSSPKRTGK